MKHLLTIDDLSPTQLLDLLHHAERLKHEPRVAEDLLEGRTLLLLFAKPSLRTRLSFEVAMGELGGRAISYQLGESTVGEKETFRDFGAVASQYVDAIVARLHAQRDLEELARGATVPVVNGLTDEEHPCQALGDLLTMSEVRPLQAATLAYVGDAHNNVTHSLLLGGAMLGVRLRIGCPEGMAPDPGILRRARAHAQGSGGDVFVTSDPEKAVRGADLIYTDTWMSYHVPEDEREARARILEPYRVDGRLMRAAEGAKFMHCLPATRGEEVTDEVLDSRDSIVLPQAENRLHAQKALLLALLRPTISDAILRARR